LALRAAAPIHDFGLVDLKSHVISGAKTRCRADGTININDASTNAANQMVVIIVNSVFV
jgi:hypothetical protein